MYTKNEKVKTWHNDSDKRIYEDYLSQLHNNYEVYRLDELIQVIDSFVGNKEFKKFYTHCEFSNEDEYDFDLKSIPILHGAFDAFNILDYLPYPLPFTHHMLILRSIQAIVGVIQLSFVHHNNRLLTMDDDRIIKLSEILHYVTFFVEDFDNPENQYVEHDYEYYKKFFKKAKKTYWKNKEVKNLAKIISRWIINIVGMTDYMFEVNKILGYAVNYLMVCNALKNNRDAVDFEDVVVGYLTCYKLIFNDIRPLVYELYDDAKWGYVDKKIREYKPLDKSPLDTSVIGF